MAIKLQSHITKCQMLGFPVKLNCIYFREKCLGKLGLRSSSHFGLLQLCCNFIISPHTGDVSLSKQSFPFHRNPRTVFLTIEP